MKHKLRIEELNVESFVVAAETPGGRGTVRAFDGPKPPQETVAQFTCLQDDCQPSFELTCVQPCPVVLETVNEFTCLVDDCQPTFVYSCPADPDLC